ncbi:hypothetical protein AKJ57_03710 [candidate division MSBL1 archaeon SCGC-AAA259A05]|uniref:Restriction system protein Mrr-like N-terminal domain-containing protein n=1 Tax=candidate division MSBL1 archaeon SCGC-AAA259A05 TaxID=1698259 RepID=A0A133U9F6_9EURY|nr:hypothetical protein AKJ57_03710 [candidate division MSBL1 archaeon SCGC-AAA259A05]
MKQKNIDEFYLRTQLEKLSERELEILKALKNIPNGLKARQISGEILPRKTRKGGPSFQSGRRLKPVLENLREKGLLKSDGKKPYQWKITPDGEKILEVSFDA